MKKKMKKYDGMDTYGAPTKKEKFKKGYLVVLTKKCQENRFFLDRKIAIVD